MDFFGIGYQELVFVLIILLIFVGPEKLPKFAGMLGRGIRQLKEATTELSKDFQEMADEVKDAGKEVNSTVNPATGLTGELRDVAREIEDVRKEINTALKADMGLIKGLVKETIKSENVAKEESMAPNPVPAEEADTRKEEDNIERQA